MRKYTEVVPIAKSEAEQIFASDQADNICDAMVGIAFFEQDWKWAQDKCLSFLESTNTDVSRLAATCLGHIARIHHKIEKKVIAALRSRLNDANIAGQVEDALDDIEQFT